MTTKINNTTYLQSKSSIDMTQIRHRVEDCKSKVIELQMLGGKSVDKEHFKEILEYLQTKNVKIDGVHTPLIPTPTGKNEALGIEHINLNNPITQNIIELCNMIIEYNVNLEPKVNVILHVFEPLMRLVSSDYLQPFAETIQTTPQINWNLENPSALVTEKNISDSTTDMFEVLATVKFLKEHYNLTNVFYLQDHCHYQSDIYYNLRPTTHNELRELFMPHTERIHLTWAEGDGYGERGENHGVPAQSYEVFKNTMELYKGKKLIAEVCEKDYLNCQNPLKVQEYFDRYLSEAQNN